jgi:hypothetical protein
MQEASSLATPREQFDEVLNELSVEGVLVIGGGMANRTYTKIAS